MHVDVSTENVLKHRGPQDTDMDGVGTRKLAHAFVKTWLARGLIFWLLPKHGWDMDETWLGYGCNMVCVVGRNCVIDCVCVVSGWQVGVIVCARHPRWAREVQRLFAVPCSRYWKVGTRMGEW